MATRSYDDNVIAQLVERHLVEDVVIRYATALDRRDWDQLRACFTDAAVADYGGLGRYEGADTIVDGCRGPLSRLGASQHLLGNIVVEFTGDDTAIATSKVQAQHFLVNDEGGSTATIGGTYVDEMVRSPDGWRIALLRFETSWRAGNAAILMERRGPDEHGRRR